MVVIFNEHNATKKFLQIFKIKICEMSEKRSQVTMILQLQNSSSVG